MGRMGRRRNWGAKGALRALQTGFRKSASVRWEGNVDVAIVEDWRYGAAQAGHLWRHSNRGGWWRPTGSNMQVLLGWEVRDGGPRRRNSWPHFVLVVALG